MIDGKNITLLELTIPMNTKDGLSNARERKQAKRNYISLDILHPWKPLKLVPLGQFSRDSYTLDHVTHITELKLLLLFLIVIDPQSGTIIVYYNYIL